MTLITYLAALLAVASSDPIYTTQSSEQFAHNVEAYQSAIEQQQQGVYGDQSQYSQPNYGQSEAGYSQGHSVAFPSGQTSFAGQSTYTGNGFAGNGYQQQQQQRPSTEKTARIISFQNENKGNSYQYSYETENGIKVQERGESQGKGIRAQGGYSYTGDDGQVYTVTYTADENGFHPQGAHLPTPPPIPEAIQKSIELNTREAVNGVYDDGIKVQERGESQGKGIRAQGGYSYTGDDGQVYTVTYTADENGFHPQGAHLPTPPPIPEAIQKSIELNTREAVNGVYDDGSYKEETELVRQQQHHRRPQVQQQHVQEIQHVQHIPEIQQIQHIPEQQVHHIPEQQVHHIPEQGHLPVIQELQPPQIQHYQHGQELYETPYQQDYHQEVTATTAGYHY